VDRKPSRLFELTNFLVLGVLAAGAAVFGENEFFRSVGLISFGDIVEVPAFGAL